MNRSNKQLGYSLLEVSIGIALVGIGTFMAASFFNDANKNTAYSQTNGVRVSLVQQVNRMMAQATESASVYQFDPAKTLVESSSGLENAGVWELQPPMGDTTGIIPTIPPADLIKFSLGGVEYQQDSHFLHVFKVETDPATRAITKRTVHALASRCIDSTLSSYPLRTAAILALPKPVYKDKRVYCCANPASCPSGDSDRKTLWPAIFIIRADGQNKVVPADNERKVILGAGFMTVFNRRRQPDSATFTTFIMESRCMLTPIGFKPGRFPKNCVQGDELPTPYREAFDTDLFYVLLNQATKPLASDAKGSSFMKL